AEERLEAELSRTERIRKSSSSRANFVADLLNVFSNLGIAKTVGTPAEQGVPESSNLIGEGLHLPSDVSSDIQSSIRIDLPNSAFEEIGFQFLTREGGLDFIPSALDIFETILEGTKQCVPVDGLEDACEEVVEETNYRAS